MCLTPIPAYKLPAGLNFLQDAQEFNADLRQSPTLHTQEIYTNLQLIPALLHRRLHM